MQASIVVISNNYKFIQIQALQRTSNITLSEEIKILANGPDQFARRFKGYIVNGFQF